jgi:hypothetical protein
MEMEENTCSMININLPVGTDKALMPVNVKGICFSYFMKHQLTNNAVHSPIGNMQGSPTVTLETQEQEFLMINVE